MNKKSPSPTLAVQRLLGWYQNHARPLPWRKTLDPYGIWISEIMLQQTQVGTVIPFWERWMKELPDAASLASAPLQRVYKLWEGLGYYRRARFLKEAAEIIQTQHNGAFPQTFEAMLALPGIGRYTAGAVCSIAFDQPYPVLDGNVKRVLSRYEAIREPLKDKKTENKLWKLSATWVNQALMELGATICLPRNPMCNHCPIHLSCKAFANGLQAEIPVVSIRQPATEISMTAVVLKKASLFLVRHKEKDRWHQGLWEFPSETVIDPSNKEVSPFMKLIKSRNTSPFLPVKIIKHTVTRFRIQTTAHFLDLNHASPRLLERMSGEWLTRDRLEAIPMSAAHVKIRKIVLNHLRDGMS